MIIFNAENLKIVYETKNQVLIQNYAKLNMTLFRQECQTDSIFSTKPILHSDNIQHVTSQNRIQSQKLFLTQKLCKTEHNVISTTMSNKFYIFDQNQYYIPTTFNAKHLKITHKPKNKSSHKNYTKPNPK